MQVGQLQGSRDSILSPLPWRNSDDQNMISRDSLRKIVYMAIKWLLKSKSSSLNSCNQNTRSRTVATGADVINNIG
jgi:hypothetical protein